MGKHSPTRYRREGREAFTPEMTFDEAFPLPANAGFWHKSNNEHRRDGWEAARRDHEHRIAEQAPYVEADEQAELAMTSLRGYLPDEAVELLDDLIKARISGYRG